MIRTKAHTHTKNSNKFFQRVILIFLKKYVPVSCFSYFNEDVGIIWVMSILSFVPSLSYSFLNLNFNVYMSFRHVCSGRDCGNDARSRSGSKLKVQCRHLPSETMKKKLKKVTLPVAAAMVHWEKRLHFQ